ncbi:MAG: T9SS type A sorting domain-containing protein [Bacteroidia bacterium]|nr:T9SS type A sorting domain-containing protein [Bacteroidia bacterium]
MRFRIFLFSLIFSFTCRAQQLVSAEYFFDTDPGFGNGTILSITSGDSILQNTSIATTGLSSGFHYVYIRIKDSAGNWSLCEGQRFYLYEQEVTAPSITNMELFMVNDPGFGSGFSVSVTSGDSVDEVINTALVTATTGTKRLYSRVKDAGGHWSMYESDLFYVYDSIATNTKLTKGEYFFDTDPGRGNGVPLTFSPADSFVFSLPVSTSGLTNGAHKAYIRFLNDLGQWSLYEQATFFITPDEQPSPKLASVEYFFDTDPGFGNGSPLIFSSFDSIDLISTIGIWSLDSGYHTIYIRVKDLSGVWSLYDSYSFYICNDLPAASFTSSQFGLTVNLNNSTSGANKYKWYFGDGASSQQVSPNYTFLTGGTYHISLFAYNGNCPIYDSASTDVTLAPGLQVIAGANTACAYDSLKVSIATSETYGTNNRFYIQLSDITGSFVSPLTLDSFATNKSILSSVYIPGSVTPGNKYRIRVKSTNPVVTSADNGADIIIQPATISDFSFTGDTVICSSENLLLQGRTGANLSYQWFLNNQKLTGAVTQDFQAFLEGTYRLQITNIYGCKHLSAKSVQLSVKPAPVTAEITGASMVARNQTEIYSVGSGTAGSVYNWFITGGTQISGADSATITVLWANTPTPGKVEVEETGLNGCVGERKTLNISVALGIHNPYMKSTVTAYPNPFHGSTILILSQVVSNEVIVKVMDATGAQISDQKIQATNNGTQFFIPLDLTLSPKGLYLVQVQTGNKFYYLRLLNQ